MTRTIEMQTEFEGDWNYTVRFEANKVWIGTGCETISMCFEDFDRIAAELANFRKLNALISEAA